MMSAIPVDSRFAPQLLTRDARPAIPRWDGDNGGQSGIACLLNLNRILVRFWSDSKTKHGRSSIGSIRLPPLTCFGG